LCFHDERIEQVNVWRPAIETFVFQLISQHLYIEV
jgi:hypothetical protein